MMAVPERILLEGTHVRLEPLEREHAAELLEAGKDPEVWRFLPCAPPLTPAAMTGWVEEALARAAPGAERPFLVRARENGRAAGSTRYLDIQPSNRGLEIGWTWVGAPWQRTAVNTECKYLLLRHAFETLGALRVQLKTDARNLRSQRAIERIGGVREGTLRRNRVLWDGFVRDTVCYSLLDEEWPAAKRALEARLARGAGPA